MALAAPIHRGMDRASLRSPPSLLTGWWWPPSTSPPSRAHASSRSWRPSLPRPRSWHFRRRATQVVASGALRCCGQLAGA
eukprot:8302940-Alexandrium_andersonii.AAC.1